MVSSPIQKMPKQLILAMDLHHLENNGEAILILTNDLRFAPIGAMTKIVQFKEALKSIIKVNV